jgi:hypothetical protein
MVNYAKIDLSGIEKELTGIIHRVLGGMLKELDVQKWIEAQTHRWIKKIGKKTIDERVYAYLEESEIEVPKHLRYDGKITLNDYIIRIVRETIASRTNKIINGLNITL